MGRGFLKALSLAAFTFSLLIAPQNRGGVLPRADAATVNSPKYEPLWCPRNIFYLLQGIKRAGFDVRPMRVLYIFGDTDEQDQLVNIHPRKARGARDTEWAFHVVLEINGMILDPDFGDHPHAVSVTEYFQKMWGVGHDNLGDEALFVRAIPAPDYLSSYRGNWKYFLNEDPTPALRADYWLDLSAAPDRML